LKIDETQKNTLSQKNAKKCKKAQISANKLKIYLISKKYVNFGIL
jgi:hypothetical protein